MGSQTVGRGLSIVHPYTVRPSDPSSAAPLPIVPLYGHDLLKERLLAAFQRGVLSQSLLLHGPAGVGKQRLALWLAQTLLCEKPQPPCGKCRHCRYALELTHPDMFWVFPRPRLRDGDVTTEDVKNDLAEGAAERAKASGLYPPPSGSDGVYVASVRAVVQLASITPALAKRKIFVLGDAERMVSQEGADQAANAFLKLLEEPLPDTYLILTSSSPGALLPTIRSRVVSLRVPSLPDHSVESWLDAPVVKARLDSLRLPPSKKERVRLASGAPGRLLAASEAAGATDIARRMLEVSMAGDRARALKLAMAQGASGARGSFSEVLDALTVLLSERVRQAIEDHDERIAERSARAIHLVEESKLMANGNVNPQLITDGLLRELSRSYHG